MAELASLTEVSLPSIHAHLTKLERENVVTSRGDGRTTIYFLQAEPVVAILDAAREAYGG